MNLRLGRKQRKLEKEARKSSKKEDASGNVDGRPPPMPGSVMKSAESRNSTASNNVAGQLQQPRSVLFRDKKLINGTSMQRGQYQMTERSGRASPSGSIRSAGSISLAYPGLSSYPATYMPSNGTPVPQDTQGRRLRIQSDGAYKSAGPVYEEPIPKPDYPFSNDGTGHSNKDSGLDTDSRSSSGGYYGTKSGFICANARGRSSRADTNCRNGILQQRNVFPDGSPKIIRPRGFQHPNGRASSTLGLTSSVYGSASRAGGGFARQRRWNLEDGDEEEVEQFYGSRQGWRQPFCSACSCRDDAPTVASTNTLRRFQLEEKSPVRRNPWDIDKPVSQGRRRFRREDEDDDEDDDNAFQSLPSRGRFFSVSGSMDNYGRPSPMRKPISAKFVSEDYPKDRKSYYLDAESVSSGFVRRPHDFHGQNSPQFDRTTIRL